MDKYNSTQASQDFSDGSMQSDSSQGMSTHYNPFVTSPNQTAPRVGAGLTMPAVQIDLDGNTCPSGKSPANYPSSWYRLDLSKGLGILVGLLVLGIGIVHFEGDSENVLTNLGSLWQSVTGNADINSAFTQSEPSSQLQNTDSQTVEEVEEVGEVTSFEPVVLPRSKPELTPEMVVNPYWLLPVTLEAHPTELKSPIPMSQEETWRLALSHEFTYQRHKAVKDIRTARWEGSDVLLFEALGQKKFWARMEAAIALAEYGHKVSIDEVELAIGNERSSLVKNYFSRFLKKQTPGELYILKQAIRVAEAMPRLMILRVLAPLRDRESKLYLAAARYDPSSAVQTWLEENRNEYPITSHMLAEYESSILKEWQAVAKDKNAMTMPAERDTLIVSVPHATSDDGRIIEAEVKEITHKNRPSVVDGAEIYQVIEDADENSGNLSFSDEKESSHDGIEKNMNGSDEGLDIDDDGFDDIGGKEFVLDD